MKIHKNIQQEVAEKMVDMSHPGYAREVQGIYYAVDTDGDAIFDVVMHADYNRQWNPWPDQAVAVPVDAFYIDSRADFDYTDGVDEDTTDEDEDDLYQQAVDFALGELLDEYDMADLELA